MDKINQNIKYHNILIYNKLGQNIKKHKKNTNIYFKCIKIFIILAKQLTTMKTEILRIDKEDGSETKVLIFEASMRIAKFYGSTRIGDAANIINDILNGKIFETDFAIYKLK